MSECIVAPILLLLTAPSGAGKTTVGQNLLETVPRLVRAITCTTRSPRAGERDGVDYHFLDIPTFERRVADGEFLEHAEVYGNRYGTLRNEVIDRLATSHVLLIVDVQGAEAIREAAARDPQLGSALVSVFLMPPSLAELERRLHRRKQDSIEVIHRRLAFAREEMEHWRHFDYVLISAGVNDDLAAMEKIVASEQRRVARVRRLVID
jgi:guanylate kinase